MAIKIEPKFVKAYLRKGNALLNLVRVKEAIESFQTGLDLDPENEELKGLLEEAKHELIEDSKVPEDNPMKQKFNLMFSELRDSGSKFDKLKLRYYTQDYRGVHAAAPIKNGETVVYIPHDCLLTDLQAKEHFLIQKHFDALKEKFGEGNMGHLILILYLLTELRNPDAKFKHYFETMPKSYDEFPVMFTDELMELVKGTNLFGKANTRKKTYNERYEFLKTLDLGFEFTHQECFSACILVQSRVFGIRIDEK